MFFISFFSLTILWTSSFAQPTNPSVCPKFEFSDVLYWAQQLKIQNKGFSVTGHQQSLSKMVALSYEQQRQLIAEFEKFIAAEKSLDHIWSAAKAGPDAVNEKLQKVDALRAKRESLLLTTFLLQGREARLSEIVNQKLIIRDSVQKKTDELDRLRMKCSFATEKNLFPYCKGKSLDRNLEEQMQTALRELQKAGTRAENQLHSLLAEEKFDESFLEFQDFSDVTTFASSESIFPRVLVYREQNKVLGIVIKTSPTTTEYFQGLNVNCKPTKWFIDIDGRRETFTNLKECEKAREKFAAMTPEVAQLIESRCISLFGMKVLTPKAPAKPTDRKKPVDSK